MYNRSLQLLALNIAPGQFSDETEDARTKTMTKCLKLLPLKAHAIINTQRGVPVLQDLLKSKSTALVGNVALCIAELANKKEVLVITMEHFFVV